MRKSLLITGGSERAKRRRAEAVADSNGRWVTVDLESLTVVGGMGEVLALSPQVVIVKDVEYGRAAHRTFIKWLHRSKDFLVARGGHKPERVTSPIFIFVAGIDAWQHSESYFKVVEVEDREIQRCN